MNTTIRLGAALALTTAALTGCGLLDDEPGGFKDEAVDSGAPDHDSDPGGGGDDSADPGPISWPGTWLVQVDYPIDCEWAGAGRTDSHTGSWTFNLRGRNSALEVELDEGWYWLEGAGTDTSFFLSGSFPFEGISATATAQRQDNTVTFRAESVSASQVEGEVTGRFVDETGWDCDLNGASFVMSR